MGGVIIGIIAIFIIFGLIGMVGEMGIGIIIFALIGGGIGFALGNLASQGWAIFGAVLGVLMAIAAKNEIS
jgi:hypothetical protein